MRLNRRRQRRCETVLLSLFLKGTFLKSEDPRMKPEVQRFRMLSANNNYFFVIFNM